MSEKGAWVQEKGREVFGNVFSGNWKEIASGVFVGRCPGEHLHTGGKGGEQDARIYCGYGAGGQSPGVYCFHKGCAGILSDLNTKFRDLIFEKCGPGNAQKSKDGVAAPPKGKAAKPVNELYDEALLKKTVEGVEEVDAEWFIARSPVDPRKVTPGEFLSSIFLTGERALVFTNFYSQGDFGWVVGKGGYRLGDQKGVTAVKSALPVNGGKDGVWFLSNPVTLTWEPNPRREGRLSRRGQEAVTAWRYLVLESDDAPAHLWLKFLAAFPGKIRAIYSSGGRSWHALVYVGMETWPEMDGLLRGNPKASSSAARMGAKRVWSMFGADPGALTPVRLTRLPGCLRNGKEQRLIYLNPGEECKVELEGKWVVKRIVDLVPRREVRK